MVNVRSRFSLYQAVERLERLGLVEARETESSPSHPDRVVYAITGKGRETATQWLGEMLRSTGDDYPEFVAAISVLVALSPSDALAHLSARAAVLAAELAWVEGVVEDLRTGNLTWNEQWRRAVAAAYDEESGT
ncbi:PadR family transcriptional regulator [Nonomuraea sp. NPDC050556]|uniref:PadR family transcriptional regulator n=1 Tax=Nonomuraea sp. NPDC050556 TaxID=3364369 RepID=UPI00378E517D